MRRTPRTGGQFVMLSGLCLGPPSCSWGGGFWDSREPLGGSHPSTLKPPGAHGGIFGACRPIF
eukprot:5842143-Pyramimonas_sp.AAC.1